MNAYEKMREALRYVKQWSEDCRGEEMTFVKFRERNRLRQVKKCCASCRFGEVKWEGECRCHHPSLDDPDSVWNNTMTDDVCNKWTKPR